MLTAPRELRWVEHELPPVGPYDLLIETEAGAISIGTELPLYCGTSRNSRPATYPRMTGYESVGIVRAQGAAVHRIKVGDRVVATYGHRTAAVVRATKAIVVPPGINDQLALLTILTGDVATGVNKLGVALGGPVLVTGAGAIGCLAVFILNARAAPIVDIVEPVARRRSKAIALGAKSAVAPEQADALPTDYAGGVECSSRDDAFALLQAHMRPGGRICVLADGNIEPLTLSSEFHERELTAFGSSDCRDYRTHARWYWALARENRRGLTQLFDRVVNADELPDTFERLASGVFTPTKVLVRYGD